MCNVIIIVFYKSVRIHCPHCRIRVLWDKALSTQKEACVHFLTEDFPEKTYWICGGFYSFPCLNNLQSIHFLFIEYFFSSHPFCKKIFLGRFWRNYCTSYANCFRSFNFLPISLISSHPLIPLSPAAQFLVWS